MTDPMTSLNAAREHLAEVLPEPTERQKWALDDLDRAIERLRRQFVDPKTEDTVMFGGGE